MFHGIYHQYDFCFFFFLSLSKPDCAFGKGSIFTPERSGLVRAVALVVCLFFSLSEQDSDFGKWSIFTPGGLGWSERWPWSYSRRLYLKRVESTPAVFIQLAFFFIILYVILIMFHEISRRFNLCFYTVVLCSMEFISMIFFFFFFSIFSLSKHDSDFGEGSLFTPEWLCFVRGMALVLTRLRLPRRSLFAAQLPCLREG